MTTNYYPSLEEFLAAPMEEVAKVAPATIVFSAGGTRRSAELAGISPTSNNYVRWAQEKLIRCLDLMFEHGIRHIIVVTLTPGNFNEVTIGYRDKLVEWVNWSVSGPEALADYARLGWRVRLVGSDSWPEFRDTAKRLQKVTSPQNSPTVWFTVAPKDDSPWEELVAAVQKKQARTRQEAIEALYGEDIPLATLLLSFGKPLVFPAIVPPLLMGNLQCYWTQRPYDLDQDTFRTILYDYAYLRKTWRSDKSGRAEKALKYRTVWEQGPIIGLGMRLGPFWYPAPISPPPEEDR